MMTPRAVHAGSGYRYLLRSVATNDAEPDAEHGDRLSEYYAAKGTPAGRWHGAGVTALNSETVIDGAEVTEDQMAALFGEGLHPDADAMIANGSSIKGTRLGRAFPIYHDKKPVLIALSKAEKQFREANDRRPTEEERSQLALDVAQEHFAAAHGGRAPVDGKEAISWLNREQDNVKQAVAAYDMTFSPVKSVSTLWALSDKETANVIAAAHHEAVAEAMQWFEDNALYTRVGVNGIQQVKTDGIISAEFTHFDTRGSDPDLHSHVLVSNKVRVADTPEAEKAGGERGTKAGQWKTIDGQQVFQHHHNISGVYNTALQQRLTEALGVEFTAVTKRAGVEPVWEIKGIPTDLNERFSSRRAWAKPVYERMVSDYVASHGRQPSRRTSHAMWQAAILETRDAKKPAESLDVLRSRWRDVAQELVSDKQIDRLLNDAQKAKVDRPTYNPQMRETVAADAISSVLSRRASFKRSHVHTAVSEHLHAYRFDNNEQRKQAYEHIVATALDEQSVCLTPPETLALPDALVTETGVGIDRKNNAEIYTTSGQLDRERHILNAASNPSPVFVASATVDAAVEGFSERRGFSLNEESVAMVEHLVNAGTQVAVAVGPAGTGKTTRMEVVADIWQSEGHQVVGLAPSAAAASILSEDLGTTARTIDSLTYAWKQAEIDGYTGADRLAKLPVELAPGDMLMVDEAGMASTENLSLLVEIAEESGAVIRMVGDPAQLDAVETGGIFRTLTNAPGTPMLTDVKRMGDDTEQAQATLDIRAGRVSGLDLYLERGWVSDGARHEMITAAVDGYLNDQAAGIKSMVIAPTNDDVNTMNAMIQQTHLDSGEVSSRGRTVTLSDGLTAHKGDTILARKNELIGRGREGTRVMNGQLMTVRTVRKDGSIDAFDPRTQSQVHLPAYYVADNTQLGYASTVHRAQGATVETVHGLVDAKLDRNSLYVLLTRGKVSNRMYVDTSFGVDETAEDAHVHHSGDEEPNDPEYILHGCVHHDHSQLSAIDEMRGQLDEATSPERIEALYLEGVARATDSFTYITTAEMVESLPAIHAAAIQADADGYEAIEHAVSAAANAGVDARQLWLSVSDDIDWADSPGRLIASRMRNATDTYLDTTSRLDKLLDGKMDLSEVSAASRHELSDAVTEAKHHGINIEKVWSTVTDGVVADANAATTVADNLRELTEDIDNPGSLLDSWIGQLDAEHRVALQRSAVDKATAAEELGQALREGLDAREIWVDALSKAEWGDTPAGDISDAFRQVTEQARSSADTQDNRTTSPEAVAEEDKPLPVPPPMIAASDAELAVWLDTTHDELTALAAAETDDTANTEQSHTEELEQQGWGQNTDLTVGSALDTDDPFGAEDPFDTGDPFAVEDPSTPLPTEQPGYDEPTYTPAQNPEHGPEI